MSEKIYLCPGCNAIVQRLGGTERLPTCEVGHYLRDRVAGFAFIIGGEFKLFALGFFSSFGALAAGGFFIQTYCLYLLLSGSWLRVNTEPSQTARNWLRLSRMLKGVVLQ